LNIRKWDRIPANDQSKILAHCHATQGTKVWLNAETFAKHKATVPDKFAYILGDGKGPKSKPNSLGCLVYSSIHDSIKANNSRFTSNQVPDARQVSLLKAACSNSFTLKLSQMINKNAIIAEYTESCHQKGTLSKVTTIKKIKPTTKPTIYPTISQLIRGCLMKQSLNHQYIVLDVVRDNVIVELLKPSKVFFDRGRCRKPLQGQLLVPRDDS
jgi:hypothetical protein